jgi:nitroimidazol reductase NimA-like FMN-containing flavoprotein (pyridoxamine 5'-phosphate oxidase superfamily)
MKDSVNMPAYHMHNRPDREIQDQTAISEILLNGKFCVISMCRDNEPYIVTLSYGYDSALNSLFFHCAKKGLKLDFIRQNSGVCATIVEDKGYAVNECAHNYRTAVFWGTMSVVTELDEKKHGMGILINHLEKDQQIIMDNLQKSEDFYSKMEVLRLDIGQIHCKEGR